MGAAMRESRRPNAAQVRGACAHMALCKRGLALLEFQTLQHGTVSPDYSFAQNTPQNIVFTMGRSPTRPLAMAHLTGGNGGYAGQPRPATTCQKGRSLTTAEPAGVVKALVWFW